MTDRKTKQQRREEAITRQARYDTLTVQEKLVRLQERPGESRREHNRLWALVKKTAVTR